MALDLYRTGKAYTISEAAKLAETTPQTVRRWLKGYEHEAHRMESVFGERRESRPLSFLELAEIIVAARFRASGGRLQKVRDAHTFARERWPELPFPFASLRLKMLGGEMIHEFDEQYGGKSLAISTGNPATATGAVQKNGQQYAIPAMVEDAIELFDFDQQDEMAERWYPAGRNVPIVLDPRIAGGRLSILGRGVTVAAIIRRFCDGKQSIDFIARDLDLRRSQVEEALKFAEAA